MFGFFTRKTNTHSVTQTDKDWIEENLIWFIETFGLDLLQKSPFILPTPESFPFNNLQDETQFQNLFERICAHWNINPNEIIVKFFDDIASKQWSTWGYAENQKSAAGLFNQIYSTDEKRFKIQIAKSNLSNPELLINVISHELGHVKLLGKNLINRKDLDMEPLTDLSSIFFGFGIFMANTSITKIEYGLAKTGYLQSQIISYTNALLCFITDKNAEEYIPYLNQNTREIFWNDFNYLKNTNDTLLDKWTVNNAISTYTNNKKVDDSFNTRNFDEVIEATKELLKITPKDKSLFNTLGYALQQQKKYEEAIIEFTKAIDIDPYWDYPYNNRGYCKLQLKDYDNAFPDLHSSFEMNPTNSFSWRNMGVYYLIHKDFNKALYHIEEAEKLDPSTEIINFYLAKAHFKLNNHEKSKYYMDKSLEINEYNDSIMD